MITNELKEMYSQSIQNPRHLCWMGTALWHSRKVVGLILRWELLKERSWCLHVSLVWLSTVQRHSVYLIFDMSYLIFDCTLYITPYLLLFIIKCL